MTMLIKALLVLLSVSVATPYAPAMSDPPAPHTIVNHRMTVDGQVIAWSVMIPDQAEPGGPAILFLHGMGECGTDGKRQMAVGFPAEVQKNPERWPFVVIVPQKPDQRLEWEDYTDAVLTMLDETAENGLYDPERLAITGLSQGGHGTITIGGGHADRFRAAAPVCGYIARRIDTNRQYIHSRPPTAADPWVIAAAENLSAMPVWMFHGDQDPVIAVQESRALHAALESLDADTTYTELPGVRHNAWDDAYSSTDLAAWFKKHTQ